MNETCKICGYWLGLHEFQTMKCPVDGHENNMFRETVYQVDDDELTALCARVVELEQELGNCLWVIENGGFSAGSIGIQKAKSARAVLEKGQGK